VQTFLPYFRQAKVHDLRLSFHVAEVSGKVFVVVVSYVHLAVVKVLLCGDLNVHTESVIIRPHRSTSACCY